jgi:anti-sigma B factor antagonist
MISPELTIHSYEQDRQIVLVLRGELDIASAPLLADALIETLEQHAAGVLLDIGAVQFVDSTGLRAILAARALCAERAWKFALTPPAPSVQRLFEVTGVLDQLPCRETDGSPHGTVQIWPQRRA